MNKRPEFFISIIAGVADMPRWLTQDERGTLEEAVCYVQRQNGMYELREMSTRIVALAILTGEKFSCLLVTPEIAATFEPAVIDAYAQGRKTKVADQARRVRERIYSMRSDSADDVLDELDNSVLETLFEEAGE